MHRIDCFVDPACPWCWVVSNWIRTVRDHTDLEVRWRLSSLALLDETADAPPPPHIAVMHARGRSCLAVLAAVRRHAGERAMDVTLRAMGVDLVAPRLQRYLTG